MVIQNAANTKVKQEPAYLKCNGTERVDVGAGSGLSIFFICDKINQFRRSPADRSWVVGIEWQVIALGKYRRQSEICYVCVSSAVNQYVVLCSL
jgi:hypothetical protein